MIQAIINGVVHDVYEFLPSITEDRQIGLIKEEIRNKEKHERERDWKQMARQNYRKR